MSKFGRFQVPEPLSSLERLHFHHRSGITLREVDHEPKVNVLDQEDLLEQGIDVSTFIPGAPRGVDALGSCTANATMSALSNRLTKQEFATVVYQLGKQTPTDAYADTVAVERGAIGFYHVCTAQTGQTSQEWPPTDCGSSGPYIVQELEKLGLIKSDKIAHGPENIVSLLQSDGELLGTPWLKPWMDPDAHGFIDGDGRPETIARQIKAGVAGGHEIYLSAIEKLAFLRTGAVDVFNTVLRLRNSWTRSWGDNGSARIHLSTLVAIERYIDVRQIVLAA